MLQRRAGLRAVRLRLAWAIASVLALTSASALSAEADLQVYLRPQIVAWLPDGRRVNFTCMGKGGPTTILESGWGTPSTSWHEIQPRLAKVTRVCVFDRAGYGFSDPGLLPRDSAAAVADLHNALKAAGPRNIPSNVTS